MSIYRGRAFTELQQMVEKMISEGEEFINLEELKAEMQKISYSQFQKRTSPKEVADEFSSFVNSTYNEDEFVDYVTSDHRTLQQSSFRIFYRCMERWAEFLDQGRYDMRNEATCRMSAKMVKATEDDGIPLV